MLNNQEAEKVTHAIPKIDVHSIFHTIQGEGPFVGYPAVFFRMAGCNLQCPLCDTDYTTNREKLYIFQAYNMIDELFLKHPKTSLLVITGGEPFRQPLALTNLVKIILAQMPGVLVQIETNGTLPLPDSLFHEENRITIVVSPKTGKVATSTEKAAACFKYVATNYDLDEDGLPIYALGHSAKPKLARPIVRRQRMPIYLQPADMKEPLQNKLNQDAVVESCINNGYLLCLQTHKIIGVE